MAKAVVRPFALRGVNGGLKLQRPAGGRRSA